MALFSSHLTPFVIEIWLLYAIAVIFTITRLISRMKISGWRNVKADDFLAVLAILFYTVSTVIAYRGGRALFSAGDAKSGDPKVIESLPHDDEQYQLWVYGAILHFVSWPTYIGTLWALKLSILFLYKRLTAGVLGEYWTRIKIGFVLVGLSWLVFILTLFLTCRPFARNFSPSPYPSNACQAAASLTLNWTIYSLNVLTDLYLMAIPMPLLAEANIKLWKKLGLLLLFSGGLIVVIFATVRCVLITKHSERAVPISGLWAVRESFVAVLTTNLPMNFGLIRNLLGSAFRTSRDSSKEQDENVVETYGKTGRKKFPGGARLSVMTIPSEEMIVNPDDIEMPHVHRLSREPLYQESGQAAKRP